jgi:hypothetical protein
MALNEEDPPLMSLAAIEEEFRSYRAVVAAQLSSRREPDDDHAQSELTKRAPLLPLPSRRWIRRR